MQANMPCFATFFIFLILCACQTHDESGNEQESQIEQRKLPMWVNVLVKRKGDVVNPRLNAVDGMPFSFRVENELSSDLLKFQGHHRGQTVVFDLTVENKRTNAPDFSYVLKSEEMKWGETKTVSRKMQDGSVIEAFVTVSEGRAPDRH